MRDKNQKYRHLLWIIGDKFDVVNTSVVTKGRIGCSVISGNFCVKFQVKNKLDGFSCVLVVVYGAAQADRKPNFFG